MVFEKSIFSLSANNNKPKEWAAGTVRLPSQIVYTIGATCNIILLLLQLLLPGPDRGRRSQIPDPRSQFPAPQFSDFPVFRPQIPILRTPFPKFAAAAVSQLQLKVARAAAPNSGQTIQLGSTLWIKFKKKK